MASKSSCLSIEGCLTTCQKCFEFVDQWPLCSFDFRPCHVEVEKLRSINFGELYAPTCSGRPLHRHEIALEGSWIAVSRKCPSVNDLPSFLLNRLQGYERRLRLDAGFFLEFSYGGHQQIFARIDLSLGDRPRIVIFVFEERTARMSQQDLGNAVLDAIINRPALVLGMVIIPAERSLHEQ